MHPLVLSLVPIGALLLPFQAQQLPPTEAWEGPPVHYDGPATEGPVERLARRLDAGTLRLERAPSNGFLPALLQALEIEVSSQVLVFSRTSFQENRIAPRTPRSIYFGDDAYVGAIPGSPMIEITSMDPELGPTFYTLEDEGDAAPVLTRRFGECLRCHASSRTRDWPGHIVRSVHPDATGRPILRSGTDLVNHTTSFEDRWGGWYVTGTHGEARHRGNAIASSETGQVDPEDGANVESLEGFFRTSRYLSPHSDIVALLVLEHQAEMQNVLARAAYQVKLALKRQEDMNRYLDDPPGTVRDATRRIVGNQARVVVEYMLFVGEAKLPAPVQGTSSFARDFESRGRRDSKGRSLRDLDLTERLFRYPCSYVVYSEGFAGLPGVLREAVIRELGLQLEEGSHLGRETRMAIGEILRETYVGWPGGR